MRKIGYWYNKGVHSHLKLVLPKKKLIREKWVDRQRKVK